MKENYKKKYKISYPKTSLFLLILVVSLYFVNRNNTLYVNNELVYHGPHIGNNLTKYDDSGGYFQMMAAAARSRFQRRKNTTTINNIASAATATTSTSIQTQTTSSNNIVQTQPLSSGTVAGADKGYGIAAGGSLTYLGQSDLDNFFSGLKDLGVTWVRWDIDWERVQPIGPNDYNWTSIDMVANTAKRYGIKSLAIITYAPQWAEGPSCPTNKRCPPQDPNTFANFSSVVASRYKGIISAYEIWNEENYLAFWYPAANAQEYINLLESSYYEIKKVDPTVTVLSGGLAPTIDGGGSLSPATFVNVFYTSNAHNYFDAIAFHPYTYPASPDLVASWSGWEQMKNVRNMMVSYGESNKKIWVTEYGAPTGGPGTMRDLDQLTFTYGKDYMSETAQESMAKRTAELYSQNRSWMGGFFWYSLRDDGTNTNDPENFFGLLRNDWSKKPAYDTLKNLIGTIQ